MAEKLSIYKCNVCGNVVELVIKGGGELVCCGQPMTLMDEKNKEGAGEKHLPVVEKTDCGVLVKVGSIPHPMESSHWIQFIEVITKENNVFRKELLPGDKPEATFCIDESKISQVRELCNIHGLWTKK